MHFFGIVISRRPTAVRSERDEARTSRTRSEASVSAGAQADQQEAAEGALKSAEHKIKEVEEFIENKKDDIMAASLVQAEAKIKAAQDIVVQGKAKIDAGARGEAFILFKKAHRTAQEAKLLVELEHELNVSVEAENEDENSEEGEEENGTQEGNEDEEDKDEEKKTGLDRAEEARGQHETSLKL